MIAADAIAAPKRPSLAQMLVRSLSIHHTILSRTADGTIDAYANGLRTNGDIRGYMRAHATLRKWGALCAGTVTESGLELLAALNARTKESR